MSVESSLAHSKCCTTCCVCENTSVLSSQTALSEQRAQLVRMLECVQHSMRWVMTQTEFSPMNRCVIEKKYFKAYVSRIESNPLKMYDISPQDFAHHVRHATSWTDLGVRCGLERGRFGHIRNHDKLSMIQQKVEEV